jgi:hypothetical protein
MIHVMVQGNDGDASELKTVGRALSSIHEMLTSIKGKTQPNLESEKWGRDLLEVENAAYRLIRGEPRCLKGAAGSGGRNHTSGCARPKLTQSMMRGDDGVTAEGFAAAEHMSIDAIYQAAVTMP